MWIHLNFWYCLENALSCKLIISRFFWVIILLHSSISGIYLNKLLTKRNMQVVFFKNKVPQRIRKGNSIGLTFKFIYLLLISLCAFFWSCEIIVFFSSLTYVVAMPFYSASLIETVQVMYFSTLFLSCIDFVKNSELQTLYHALAYTTK